MVRNRTCRTQIIDQYSGIDATWAPDIVGRAWGNRGNARSRQGKLDAALQDYNQAIEICPWSVDPLLNRGAVLEQLGRSVPVAIKLDALPLLESPLVSSHLPAMLRCPQCRLLTAQISYRFKEAEDDYLSILEVAPNDAAAWNNLGNTNLGMQNWDAAVEYFGKAAALSPQFSFASANRCVALFAAGRVNESMREMRGILRRYPDFPDTRAALTAALWSVGKEADAETNWCVPRLLAICVRIVHCTAAFHDDVCMMRCAIVSQVWQKM